MGIPLGVFEGEVGGGFTRFHGGKGGEVEGKRKEGDKEVVHLFTIPRNIGWSRGSRLAKRPQGLGPEIDAEACVPTGLARGEGGLNLSEVGKLERGGGLLGVFYDPAFIDNDSGSSADGAEPDQVRQQGAVLLADFLVQVAEQGNLDLFFVGPSLLGEGRINADTVNGSIQLLVSGEAGGDIAHLFGADAGKGEWEKEKDGLFLAEVVGKFDVFEVFASFCFEGELGCFCSYGNGHMCSFAFSCGQGHRSCLMLREELLFVKVSHDPCRLPRCI